MTWLLTSDLHLTDRPRDAYRFELFAWLAKQQEKHSVTATFILGDLTDKKDKHSASLVNRLVDELIGLKPPVYILRGNHDGVDPSNPYFRFLNTIDGVQFIVDPICLPEHQVAMIPHQPDQESLDSACGLLIPTTPGWGPKAVFLHQCLTGAISEASGARLTGLAWPLVSQTHARLGVYAGDIHRPQRLDNGVTYVGAPYHVRFGDDYTPRVLLLRDGKEQNLYFPAPRKWALTVQHEDDIFNDEDLHEGDQVRLTVELGREEAVEWSDRRKRILHVCKEAGLDVYGCELKVRSGKQERAVLKAVRSNEEVFTAFCQAEGVANNIRKAGLSLLGGTNDNRSGTGKAGT